MARWMLQVDGGESYGLETVTALLGRDDDCDVAFGEEYPSVSRHHARLEVHENGVLVTDLESRNGTRINGIAIESPTLVRHGEMVVFGRVPALVIDTRRQADTAGRAATIVSESPMVAASRPAVPPASAMSLGAAPEVEVRVPTASPPPAPPAPAVEAVRSVPGKATGTPPGFALPMLIGGALLLVLGGGAWMHYSSQVNNAQSGVGGLIGAFSQDYRTQVEQLRTIATLGGTAAIAGLAAMLIGAAVYFRRT